MRRFSVGLCVASCIVALACQNTGGPPNPATPNGAPGAYGQPPPGYGAPPAYGQAQVGPYGQPPAGYPAQPSAQPQATYPQAPGYPAAPAQPGYPSPPPPGYPPGPPAPAPGAPPGTPAPVSGAGTMAVPGPAAFPCANDSACGLAHCNAQYGKCAFPCADANVDCIQGAACLAGFCVPKLPGS